MIFYDAQGNLHQPEQSEGDVFTSKFTKADPEKMLASTQTTSKEQQSILDKLPQSQAFLKPMEFVNGFEKDKAGQTSDSSTDKTSKQHDLRPEDKKRIDELAEKYGYGLNDKQKAELKAGLAAVYTGDKEGLAKLPDLDDKTWRSCKASLKDMGYRVGESTTMTIGAGGGRDIIIVPPGKNEGISISHTYAGSMAPELRPPDKHEISSVTVGNKDTDYKTSFGTTGSGPEIISQSDKPKDVDNSVGKVSDAAHSATDSNEVLEKQEAAAAQKIDELVKGYDPSNPASKAALQEFIDKCNNKYSTKDEIFGDYTKIKAIYDQLSPETKELIQFSMDKNGNGWLHIKNPQTAAQDTSAPPTSDTSAPSAGTDSSKPSSDSTPNTDASAPPTDSSKPSGDTTQPAPGTDSQATELEKAIVESCIKNLPQDKQKEVMAAIEAVLNQDPKALENFIKSADPAELKAFKASLEKLGYAVTEKPGGSTNCETNDMRIYDPRQHKVTHIHEETWGGFAPPDLPNSTAHSVKVNYE